MRRDYRLIKRGEPIMDGDERLALATNLRWKKIVAKDWGFVDELAGLVRRPATGPASAGQMIEVLEAEIAFLRQLLAQKGSA